MGEITRLLAAHREGDDEALDRLVPLVYDDLRRIARARVRGNSVGETLNPTSLVNEVWMRLSRQEPGVAVDRNHFLSVCARAMRQIVVSHARQRQRLKRGGDDLPVTLGEEIASPTTSPEAIVDLDRALVRLSSYAPELVRVVECRHFAGMTGVETSEILGLSSRTVERHWVRARAWLRAELSGGLAAESRGTQGPP